MVSSKYKLDPHGTLLDYRDWDQDYAKQTAAQLQIELTPEHWEVIEFAREIFARDLLSPNLRRLLSNLSKRDPKWNSRKIHKLFGENPGLQVAKIAGILIPSDCF